MTEHDKFSEEGYLEEILSLEDNIVLVSLASDINNRINSVVAALSMIEDCVVQKDIDQDLKGYKECINIAKRNSQDIANIAQAILRYSELRKKD